jgi:hypothetical protein
MVYTTPRSLVVNSASNFSPGALDVRAGAFHPVDDRDDPLDHRAGLT